MEAAEYQEKAKAFDNHGPTHAATAAALGLATNPEAA